MAPTNGTQPAIPKVLLVDDDEICLKLLSDGLRRHLGERFEIVLASDGVEALGRIVLHSPQVVVSDLRMPKLDGLELLLACREHFANLPLILTSANLSEDLEYLARSFGAAAVLHKPLDLAGLSEAVEAALRGQLRRGANADGFLSGVSLQGVLQLLELERVTCCLEVHGGGRRDGLLWLENGRLIDAQRGPAVGTAAALNILAWRDTRLSLKRTRTPTARISASLNFLLLEAARLSDEEGQRAPPGKAEAVEDSPRFLQDP